MNNAVISTAKTLIEQMEGLDKDDLVDSLNQVREMLHTISPFNTEPVDFVKWVKNDKVIANDYNPNKVAPPEMELLEVSILNDGYTQPIVTWPQGENTEVIDGFHRSRVGKESALVKKRVHEYLPTVIIRKVQEGKNDRIASTIRHNRARGKHQIDAMSEIVLELKNRNWTNKRIAKELGMDEDEILRLCQISGLEHLFSDADFSRAWESDDSFADDYEEHSESLADDIENSYNEVRTANTSDPNRIFHTFDKWECVDAGFYASKKEGMTKQEAVEAYAEFLKDSVTFSKGCERVIKEWKNSCEQYLSNTAMNRIAWMGQAAACLSEGLPSTFCSGFNLLSEDDKEEANKVALKYINQWMVENDRETLSMSEALSVGRQVEIY